MSNEWENITLGEIVNKIVGGGTPARKNPEYYNGTIPWITVKDVADSDFYKWDAIEHVTPEAIQNSASNLIDKDAIIIATRMGLGRGFINTRPMAINQDMKALIVSKSKANNAYILYWFKSIADQVEAMGSGSTVKGITLDTLRELIVPLPPPSPNKKKSPPSSPP